MWWFEHRPGARWAIAHPLRSIGSGRVHESRFLRRSAVPLTALALALGLSGCFTPLYSSLHGQLGSELQAIAVTPAPDRFGHYVTDELLTDLNGTGSSPTPKYRLTLATKERVQSALVDTVTQRASSATVVIDIDYTLTPAGGGAPLTKGTVTSAASYNRSEQRFANIVAAQDAETRNAKVIADQITIRLSSFLATRS
jgi:LPS-assembly lipoprotein